MMCNKVVLYVSLLVLSLQSDVFPVIGLKTIGLIKHITVENALKGVIVTWFVTQAVMQSILKHIEHKNWKKAVLHGRIVEDAYEKAGKEESEEVHRCYKEMRENWNLNLAMPWKIFDYNKKKAVLQNQMNDLMIIQKKCAYRYLMNDISITSVLLQKVKEGNKYKYDEDVFKFIDMIIQEKQKSLIYEI